MKPGPLLVVLLAVVVSAGAQKTAPGAASTGAPQAQQQQTSGERQLSPVQLRMKEANKFADSFIERMNQALDVSSLWEDFFVPVEKMRNSGYALNEEFPQIGETLAKACDPALLRRKLAGEATIAYLTEAHRVLGHPIDTEAGADPEQMTSAQRELADFKAKSQFFTRVEDRARLETPGDLASYVDEVEAMANIMRANLPDSMKLTDIVKKSSRDNDDYEVRTRKWGGDPDGNGYVTARGLFRLVIVRDRKDGGFKIAQIGKREVLPTGGDK